MALENFVTGTYGTMYYVRDMAKSVQFYKDLYGKNPVMESPEWTQFDLNGSSICLHGLGEGQTEIDGKGVLIHQVKNLKETIPALKSMGIEFVKDYHQVCEGGFAVDVRDPSGNVISFFEYLG